MRGRVAATVAVILLGIGAGCGYRVAGRADMLPRTIRTIAVPAFTNITTRYKLTQQLPVAVAREFIARTRYQVISDVNTADAVLTGGVIGFNSYPVTYDPDTNRASAAQVSVLLEVTLRERATGAILYSRPRMEFRERYEISLDPNTYFEESDAALTRLSRDVARTLVSAVLERF